VQPRSTYSDDEAAALYDLLNPWGRADDFYLALALEAPSVLDVGCGTGALLRRAREAGHQGRLCGVDPDESRLNVARRRADVEWMSAKAAAMQFVREFELALMTGHAFQELVTDEDIRESLEAIRRALVDGGRFAFETRNPLARAWESWIPENAMDVVDASGREIRIWHEVEAVADGIVTLTETTGDRDGTPLRVERASMRFVDVDALARFLAEADLSIEAQYGGWRGETLEAASPEIVTVARTAHR
jgi:SAM-dependent methyltransferase